MIHSNINSAPRRRPAWLAAMGATLLFMALAISGCSNGLDPGGQVAGWTMIDAQQRHPIVVSEQPAYHAVRVARGSDSLSPHQRGGLADFIARYRGGDTSGQLSIAVPAGSANEIAALRAVADMRNIARDFGIDDSRIAVSPYQASGERDPAIRVSYTRYVAEAPECGAWPTNLGDDIRNLPYPNLGCATQRNFAMQVANPADLIGPRTMTPTTAERRDARWEKFNKGEATIAKKDQEEKASAKSEN
jgi:pilus assembly protein CpaD